MLEKQPLTPRQREVYERMLLGESAMEIGARLGISRRTVEVHKGHILRWAGARNTVELLVRKTLNRGHEGAADREEYR